MRAPQALLLSAAVACVAGQDLPPNCQKFGISARMCRGDWTNTNLRAKGPGTASALCGTGWHACGMEGSAQEIRDAIPLKACHSGTLKGTWVAAIPHATPSHRHACSATEPEAERERKLKELGCPTSRGWGHEPVCCGQGCSHKPPSCPSHIWQSGKTWCQCTDPCGNFPTSRADGVICCKDPEWAPPTKTTTTVAATTSTATATTASTATDTALQQLSKGLTAVEIAMEAQIKQLQLQVDKLDTRLMASEGLTKQQGARLSTLEEATVAERLSANEAAIAKIQAAITKTLAALPPVPPMTDDPSGCADDACKPSIESLADDITISARAGSIKLATATCGELDVCDNKDLIRAIATALNELRDA